MVDLDAGRMDPAPWRVYLSDGSGGFTGSTDPDLPQEVSGVAFDVEPADVDGDVLPDLHLASRGTGEQLLLGISPGRGS